MLAGQGSNQQISFPIRVFVTLYKQHPACGYRWFPEMNRLLHSFFFCQIRDNIAVIIDTIGNYRPTVILALFKNIQFIASLWAMLYFVENIIFPVVCKPLGVPVSVRPNRLLGAWRVYKWIIFRDTTVIVQTKNFSMIHL